MHGDCFAYIQYAVTMMEFKPSRKSACFFFTKNIIFFSFLCKEHFSIMCRFVNKHFFIVQLYLNVFFEKCNEMISSLIMLITVLVKQL